MNLRVKNNNGMRKIEMECERERERNKESGRNEFSFECLPCFSFSFIWPRILVKPLTMTENLIRYCLTPFIAFFPFQS